MGRIVFFRRPLPPDPLEGKQMMIDTVPERKRTRLSLGMRLGISSALMLLSGGFFGAAMGGSRLWIIPGLACGAVIIWFKR